MATFSIRGVFAGRPVDFAWSKGELTCSDPTAFATFREIIEAARPIKPRPHVDLLPDLSNRAFVQVFLIAHFLDSVSSVEERPPLIFEPDVR